MKYRNGIAPGGRYFNEEGNLVMEEMEWGSFATGPGSYAERMSGHRDMALTLLFDTLAGTLSGMGSAMDLAVPDPPPPGLEAPPRGGTIIALDVEAFTPLGQFKERLDRTIDSAKEARLEQGFEEILMPGERGYREEERRRREGVPIYGRIWEKVEKLWASRGLDVRNVIEGGVVDASA
jgi:LDH2 family malate/lactate/ureidoglycolate dehydrogenase